MLLILVALSALAAMLADASVFDVRVLLLIAKPLTTLLLIVLALRRGGEPRLRKAIIAGLVLSLLGDVALMFDRGFELGLAFFLIAHLCYLRAFTTDTRWMAKRWPFALYAVLIGAVLAVLWHGVPGPLLGAVVVYVVALAVMAAQAVARWRVRCDVLAMRAALGGFCFALSDGLLALDRFHAPLPLVGLWVLSTYWLAQGLIAMSLPRG